MKKLRVVGTQQVVAEHLGIDGRVSANSTATVRVWTTV
ncbi:UNVERIFIED_ORG: hypothetical protein J2X79_004509 [Arthrobacter globiformis]|nr:hypothetical protein [Arthrobacter globiformis]